MKTSISIAALVLLLPLTALAQGTLNFSMHVSGTVVAHVYAESEYLFQSGNSPTERPPGTTIYTGPRLTGSGFSANLWAANGPGQPESSLVLVPGSLTSFRTGATLGGTPAPFPEIGIPNVPGGSTGTFQIRAWDNEGGIYSSWETARYRGKSALFEVSSLFDGGGLRLPPDMPNVRSFSFYDPLLVPEPSTYALLALGAVGLWLFRRRQPGLESRQKLLSPKLQPGKPKETKMKMYLPTTAILLLFTLGAMGQGVVNFSTRVSGTVIGHVYGFVDGEGPKSGNTASETPAGAQTYAGALLAGSGFSASLWAANGTGRPESSLTLVPESLTSFRTGATLGGTPAPLTLGIPGVPPGGNGTFQIRAWDNAGGTLGSYAEAIASFRPAGKSASFDVCCLDDGVLSLPADFPNFRSFNLTITPEPGAGALLGLGALGLWLFRRKQPAA